MLGNFFQSPFHYRKYSIAVLLGLSYVLIAINSGYGFFGVVLAPDFMTAFLFTLVMATLLTSYVHELHYVSFKQWAISNKTLRLLGKIGLGVLVPIGIDLAMAQFFFTLKGESITTNTFFEIDFILIVVYILAINVFYHFENRKLAGRLRTLAFYKNNVRPAFKDLQALRTLNRLEQIKNAPVSLKEFNFKELGVLHDQIACAYKIDEVITIHYFNEQKEVTTQTINELLDSLPATEYVRINPYCFYHKLLIFSSKEISSRRLWLILRHPFNQLMHDRQRIVSQNLSRDFKII